MPNEAYATSPRGLRALVVEDAPELQQIVGTALRDEGFDVTVADDGEEGLASARRHPPDIIVLDIGLPGIDGVEVCRRMRLFSDAYVVMLTARDDELDKLVGLSVGADDYMTKPFSPRELVARLRAMLRRPRSQPADGSTSSEPELAIDADAREASLAGRALPLTRIEFDLLDTLARRPRRVMSRQQLLDAVWGPSWFGDKHVVEVHVSNLRRKLDAVTDHRYIHTVRGVGYRFEPSSPNQP
jgi:DNA-binding response OmpR family regulator